MSLPKRLDAMFGKESNGKTFWNKVGVAFLNKSENGYNVILDSMPAPQDGAYKFQLFEPKENNQSNNSGNSGSYSGNNSRPGTSRNNFDDGMSDDIPF